jgi:hypothetical protein
MFSRIELLGDKWCSTGGSTGCWQGKKFARIRREKSGEREETGEVKGPMALIPTGFECRLHRAKGLLPRQARDRRRPSDRLPGTIRCAQQWAGRACC